MAEDAFVVTYSGQEVQLTDLDLIGTTSGLADDHVLADMLRLAPYTGSNYAKAILPTGYRSQSAPATVQTSGSANGSIVVNPFRAIVGSRNTVATPPTGLSDDSAALANWRDIRSGVFVGSATILAKTIALSPNSSGFSRWDLVYASISVDADGPTVNRRVKNPTTGIIGVQTVPAYLYSPVTVAVVTGTPGSSDSPPNAVIPTLPADGAGSYNIPLAYIAVANGFGSTTTVANSEVRSTCLGATTEFMDIKAGIKAKSCNGCNDQGAAFASGGSASFAWNPAHVPTSAYPRPGPWLPPDMVGGGVFLAEIDNTSATTTAWSTVNLGLVDNSIDWRGRFFRVTGTFGGNKFGNDPTATVGATTPSGSGSATTTVSLGNSMIADGVFASGYSAVWNATIGGSYTVALVVNQTTGNLVWINNASGASDRFFFWIECSAQFPNL